MSTSTEEFKPRSDLNIWGVSGFLVNAPEAHGKVTTFTLGVRSVHNLDGDPVEGKSYAHVKVFGKRGDDCLRYLKAGREVDIVGAAESGEYELKIGDEPVFYDEEEERPVIMRPLELLTDDVQFRNGSPSGDRPYSDRNVWVGIGRLATDPEAHGGVVTFVLAVNSAHKMGGVLVEEATFFNVKVFGETGKACLENLETGREVAIAGSIESGEYELKIGDEPVFYDEEEERPVIMRPIELLTSRVRFLR